MGRLIDADKLTPRCTFKGRCDGGGGLRCDRCTDYSVEYQDIKNAPTVLPDRKTGHWILDRSGAYCCNKCMEPCATYVMMKPRDKFCKMCGSRNEVME